MMFKSLGAAILTTFITLANAAPSSYPDANSSLELGKRFSAGHNFGNSLEARYSRHHHSRAKRNSAIKGRDRKVRRSCPAHNAFSSAVVNTPAPTETEAPANIPEEAPAPSPSPDPAPAPSESNDAPSDEAGNDSPSEDSGSNPPSNDSGSSPSYSGDIQSYLDMHNGERARHGADALTWADDLAAVAQSWVNNCVWKHSGGQFGENLSTGTNMTPSGAVQVWLDEAPDYDPSNPQYSHWTQVVWKGTKEVGCAVASCPGEAMFGTNEYGSAFFYACEYRPAGNVIGQFAQNVQA